ncbi:MAG TPA: 3-hydroxy-5-phosphonooxypentane-2,4-dione thiolase [Thermoleophilia bacterium]|nr:3-hydroxy-5-phosphonooxypentane-2,4-dione thiolase [Thermoleophilia bacterium]
MDRLLVSDATSQRGGMEPIHERGRGQTRPALRRSHVMSWGLENRLARIIRPQTGRTVMLAIDHGYFLGPTSGLEDPSVQCAPLTDYADTLMLTRGVLRNCIPSDTGTPIVLRVSGGTSVLQEDLSDETIITSMEECIRLNAVGMALSVFVGAPHQHQSIANLGRLVDEGERYGIPVVAVTAVGKSMGRDARYLSLASRICAEMGAHIVKTYHCEDFENVTSTCPVPIVVAGGKKLPEAEALELTANAIAGGAVGVDMGRNIFQSDAPAAMIQAVRAVVHDDATAAEAFELYRELGAAGGGAVEAAAGAALDDERKI